jgi:hypothetical protein
MKKNIKKYIPLFVIGGILLLGAGIYIVVNHIGMATKDSLGLEPANFWRGLWQGLIICLSFVASWFDKNIVLYQANNNGFWYNLGFFIGIAISIGSSASKSNSGDKKTKSKGKINCE